MRPLLVVVTLSLVVGFSHCQPSKSRQNPSDLDAVVVDAAGGPLTPADGPGPSMLGSLDNIFGAVKNFDQYRCLERMLCEYMQEDGDTITDLISGPLSGFQPPPTAPTRPTPSPNRFAPNINQNSQFAVVNNNGAPPGFTNGNPNFATNPNFANGNFHTPPTRRPPQSAAVPSSLISGISNLFFGRRKRRQTSTQGNIIRLFQATGMDNMNLFPYVRAALIGHATRGDRVAVNTRRRNSCSQMYRECPTEPDRILDYLNNHNGGLVNHVEPSVNQEVGPILSAIVADAVGVDGGTGSSSSSSSSSSSNNAAAAGTSGFGTIDQIVTQAVLSNAASMLTGHDHGATASATNGGSSGGLTSLLSGLVPGSGTSSSTGESTLLNSALSTFSSFVQGKKK